MNRLAVFLLPFFFSTVAFAQTENAEKCLKDLSLGRNRFHQKIPLAALQQLYKGLQNHRDRLNEKSIGLLVDYTKNSKGKRSYLVDFAACDVLSFDHVIHGGAIRRSNGAVERDGDPNNDGMLDSCKNRHGNRTNMTRPGLALTAGCHQTQKEGWTEIKGDCNGVKLIGLEKSNRDIYASGVVLHELLAIHDDSSIKPMGQGCPAYPPGKLKELLRFGLFEGALVLVYAPQCKTAVPIASSEENVSR